MSVIAYFLHVDEPQLQAVRERPAVVWDVGNDPRFSSARLIDLDKDYDVLAWLISPKKRLEHAYQQAHYKAIDRETAAKANYDKAQFKRVVDEELGKLGVEPADPSKLPTEPALEALEGRGSEAQRDSRINFGLGNARLFKPEEVKRLAVALERLDVKVLRANFDRKVMTRFEVGGMDWLGEDDGAFDRYLAPAFYKIRSFYVDASRLGHHVLVIYN